MATTKGFVAMIIPIESGAHPDQGLPTPQPPGGTPPAPDQTLPGDLPIPSHPIFYPLPPGAPVDPSYGIPIDGPYPDQGLPGSQPHPDQGLPGDQPHPSHPIVLPPGGNGGWLPIYIDNTLPGDQPHPDQGLPGSQPRPDQGLPPFPSHPIVLPPDGETDDGAKIKWKAAWTSTTGWVSFAIVVPGEGTPRPTPSKRK
jgi:hypothetical protein